MYLVYFVYNIRLCEEQLKELIEIIFVYENVCVMGDLNIEDKVDGDIILLLLWIDVWLLIFGNIDNNGYIWDRSKILFILVVKKFVNVISY